MSAQQIPNLLSLRGGTRSRGIRGRGRGGATGHPTSASGPSQKDLAIQSTDTDAAVSRLSAVDLGYLDDPYASLFVDGSGTRRLPIINRGTYTRTTALDILINAFLSENDLEVSVKTKQIISLGAGTDTRYFRLRAQQKHHRLIYHEFDFPSVCATKSQIVCPEWGFSQIEDGKSVIKYCCHPLDLRRLPYSPTIQTLKHFHGIRNDIPTLIISECCLCYLGVDNAQDVVKWFADKMPSLGIILYEPIGVQDSFGQMMVANLAARNITMPTLRAFRTLEDQKQRLSELGFRDNNSGQEAESIERIWENWISSDEKERVNGLEGLDEVEEWQMLARHYAVVWGWRGDSGWSSWKSLRQTQ
ncbi:S-adenosyl-L-methionine-dependent methyltransferase [Tricladium varicosporioides]|nr:S-adenosyl-L-methionine-dependent methyltransferase [Hymenoscyphus varicosporioides]